MTAAAAAEAEPDAPAAALVGWLMKIKAKATKCQPCCVVGHTSQHTGECESFSCVNPCGCKIFGLIGSPAQSQCLRM